MPTTTHKVHDMTGESSGIGAAVRDKLADGEVVVATIFLNGRVNEYGVYVMRNDEYGSHDLRGSFLAKGRRTSLCRGARYTTASFRSGVPMSLCVYSNDVGTCTADNHAPRCTWWRVLICPGGWLAPFVILLTVATVTVAVFWRDILPF